MANGKVKLCIFYLAVCGLFLCIFLSPIYSSEYSEGKIFQEKCFRCHDLKRVFQLRKRPRQWQITVQRMKSKAPDWISGKDIEKISLFLTTNYGIDSKELFNDLCLTCHQRVGKEKMLYEIKTKSGWSRAIERMRHKYPFLIGVDDAVQISEYWTNPGNNKNLKLKITKRDKLEEVFENKCTKCHTIGFLKTKKIKPEDRDRILKRMRSKSPELINDQELKKIDQYLQ